MFWETAETISTRNHLESQEEKKEAPEEKKERNYFSFFKAYIKHNISVVFLGTEETISARNHPDVMKMWSPRIGLQGNHE